MRSQKDDAVSPVIATILLVAIVVVLVAAIAAVVLPMVGNVESAKTVAVSVDTIGTVPVVTIIGGADADELSKLIVYVSGATPEDVIEKDNPVIGMPYQPNSPVTISKGERMVSVVGLFKDGTNQTLYTAKMNFG